MKLYGNWIEIIVDLKALLKGSLITLVLVTCYNGETTAGENRWTILRKKTFKKPLDILVVNPSNPNVLYASVADTGILKSEDAGKHWELKNSGLQNRNILKIIVAPMSPDTVFACTRGGLYRSNNGGDDWETVRFAPDTSVYSVAIAPRNPDVMYAAIDKFFVKSQDGGRSWKFSRELINQNIHAIVVSPVSPSELYIGTDVGIYHLGDRQGNITIIKGPDEWEKRAIDLVIAPIRSTQFVFALLASGGVDTMGIYWAEHGKIRWRKMNEGIEAQDLPLLSLSLNPANPKTLYSVTKNGAVKNYHIAFPEIGVLDFKVLGLPEWEINNISQRIATRLSQTHSVKWLSEAEVEKIVGPQYGLTDSTTIRDIGRHLGFEIIISGEILVRQEQGSIYFKPKLTIVSSGKDTSINSVHWSRRGYYPSAIDEIVERIYEIIDHRKPRIERTLWQGYRKWLWLAPIGAFALGYGLSTVFTDDHSATPPTPMPEKLPYPPPFP